MKIYFEISDDKKEVFVKNADNDKILGQIFTPGGTSNEKTNSIQVCGFSEAFDYWGCGVFGDGKGNPKKDIALFYESDSKRDDKILRDKGNISFTDFCMRCFCLKRNCRCKELVLRNWEYIKVKLKGEMLKQLG